MTTTIKTLTQVQEEAIAYLHNSRNTKALRTRRKATKIVLTYCKAQGYSDADQHYAVRDMWDVYELEATAE
jgi:hypothetical protein